VWHDIPWKACHQRVRKLQARIAQATKAERWGKVKSLQWLLTHSFSAKALAVKRITENHGKNTAGVDGVTWSSPKAKTQALNTLKRRGYQPLPLKRIYIPKANGKKRPLSIASMHDRAMQSLYLLALDPVAETTADKNSYGFRSARSPADAIEQCFRILSKRSSAQWILAIDIQNCFDEISHAWLLQHIPMDKRILRQWLNTGFMKKGSFYPTQAGVPQGSPISPALTNLTLDGLERLLAERFKAYWDKALGKRIQPKVHIVRFADDIRVIAPSKEILEQEIKPLIEAFLEERGLKLSEHKTQTKHINQGVDFLGQNLCKYQGKLLIKPSQENIQSFLSKIKTFIKRHQQSTQADLIKTLNPRIRGWANYHQHCCAKQTFSYVDHRIWQMLWRWSKRRHPMKSSQWIKARYFKSIHGDNWAFACYTKHPHKEGLDELQNLSKASHTAIKRHIKIKQAANPYDLAWESYFESHLAKKMLASFRGKRLLTSLWKRQNGLCPSCCQSISNETGWNLHHLLAKAKGGTDQSINLVMLHPNCHRQIHSRKLSVSLSALT
jgi:RNA-directed DNA polymerase